MRTLVLRIVLGAGALFGLANGAFASSIAGRVLTSVGDLQAGEVRVFRLKIQDGHVDKLPICTAELDVQSQFTCQNIDSGRYIIQILVTSGTDSEGSKHPLPLPIYYPGVTDLALATQLEMGVSGQKWIDIRIPPGRRFSISGPLKRIPADAELRLEAQGHEVLIDTALPVTRTKDGRFLAEKVPNGHYLLTAVWRRKTTPYRLSAEVTVETLDVSQVELREEPYVTLSGTLKGEYADRVKMILVYSEENSIQKAVVDVQSGRFTIPTLPNGRYYLALPIHSTEYVLSTKQGDHESAGSSFVTRSDTATTEIEVAIASPGLQVTGSVPAVPDLGSRARVVAQEITSKHVSTVLTDDSGHFSVSGLQPGSYLFYAWPEGEDPAYRSADVLRPLERSATSLTVEKGSVARSEDLQLLHPARP